MTGTAVALDHVAVVARDLPPLIAAYERLGFALSPLSRQSGPRTPGGPVETFGSGNRCAFLRHGYIELLGLIDPTLFANGVDRFTDRYTGLHIVALAMLDEEANLARLRRAGVGIPGISRLQRPVEDGGPIAHFARLPLPDAPEGRVQLIRHLSAELVWDARWMGHANKADALTEVIIVNDPAAESAARFSRLAGLPLVPDPAGGFLLELPGAAGAAGPDAPAIRTAVRILTPEALPRVLPGMAIPALPFIAAMVVRTSDGNAAVRALLAREGIAATETPIGLMVSPDHAGGAAILFQA
jgi:hypothetical protein